MLALSEPHKPELPETLAKLKLQFSPVILARTVAADLNELDIKKFDLLALYSPSDVKAILERFPAEELPAVATFGEGTLRAAVDVGIKVKAMAPTLRSLRWPKPSIFTSRNWRKANRSKMSPSRTTPTKRSSSEPNSIS